MAPPGLVYLVRNAPAQTGIANDHLINRPAGQGRLYSPESGFNLRQFRQRTNLFLSQAKKTRHEGGFL